MKPTFKDIKKIVAEDVKKKKNYQNKEGRKQAEIAYREALASFEAWLGKID